MKKSAFPYNHGVQRDSGISQRLFIATQIATGLHAANVNEHSTINDIVSYSFQAADELIKQDKL